MKNVIFSLIFLLVVAGSLVGCNRAETNTVDPCEESPNCIPVLSDWKLPYKPYNSDCMKCHTTCTPNSSHNFCASGGSWNAAETKCLQCHAKQHK